MQVRPLSSSLFGFFERQHAASYTRAEAAVGFRHRRAGRAVQLAPPRQGLPGGVRVAETAVARWAAERKGAAIEDRLSEVRAVVGRALVTELECNDAAVR